MSATSFPFPFFYGVLDSPAVYLFHTPTVYKRLAKSTSVKEDIAPKRFQGWNKGERNMRSFVDDERLYMYNKYDCKERQIEFRSDEIERHLPSYFHFFIFNPRVLLENAENLHWCTCALSSYISLSHTHIHPPTQSSSSQTAQYSPPSSSLPTPQP